MLMVGNRRRRKAKAVAAVWETEFIQIVAALAILHYKTILKNRMNSSFSSYHLGAIHPIPSNSPETKKQLARQEIG